MNDLSFPDPQHAEGGRPDRFRVRTLLKITLATLLTLLISTLVSGVRSQPLDTGTIAYVRADTGDEIRLIEPDGSNDRRLWAHGLDDPEEQYSIWNLHWRPDARELAFVSTHENWCSLNASDVYAIEADGYGYRRVTQAPACAALAAYPKGTVRVPVSNNSFDTFTGFLYFQGAPSLQPVSLPPGGSGVVVFQDVADFGDGFMQIAVVLSGLNRDYSVGTAVDVQSGDSVTTSNFNLYNPASSWEARSASWRYDAGRIGYAYGFNALFGITPNPTPLDFGEEVVDPDSVSSNIVRLMAYGPTAAKADQILYEGFKPGESEAIYLATEDGGSAAEPLVSYASTEFIRGLAWLPDGSGFVFSVTEGEFFGPDRSANIFHYDFATEQTTRLTNLVGEFTGQLSVSPDGQKIVFDLSTAQDGSAPTDVWIMDRNGSNQMLLVANGYAPAWSLRAPQAPQRIYLPLNSRG